jgi:hypothetical protein
MSQKLDKSQLRRLFDRVTKELGGKQAEVEVASLRLGDKIEAEWVPLLGLSYDPQDDTVAIVLEGIDVTIPKPRELFFDGHGDEWASLDIIDAEGVQHIVQLKQPLLLPATQ